MIRTVVPVGIVTKMEAQNDFLDNLGAIQHEKLLREIWEDDLTPKKKNLKRQTDLYERSEDDKELWNPDNRVLIIKNISINAGRASIKVF